MSNVPLGPIDFAEVGRGIEEAMANLSPEQMAEFRRTFGGEQPPSDPYAAKNAYYTASSEVIVENGRNIRVTTDFNGKVTRTDIGPAASSANNNKTTTAFEPRPDARNTISSVLARFGLASLANYIYDVYARGEVDLNNPDALVQSIRDTPEYQTRFAANARRASKNLPELDPGSYLELENSYRTILRANGLPAQFYDSTEDFQNLIAGDVSPAELQARIQNGYRKVAQADPEVKRQMQRLYNVDDSGLAAYFLDPERATPILEAQAQAAQIAARGREQGGVLLSAMTAEELAARGFTEQEANQAFQRLNLLSGLYTEMAGEQALTEAEKIGAAFGYNVEATEQIATRQRQRLAEFQAGGQFARTTGATSGTVETGVGTAQ